MEKKFVFKWSDELTFNFIKLRAENERLFTGHRNASSQGYEEIIKIMGLEGKVTQQQCKKKWENLKKKYKDLALPKTGSGTDAGEVTAASWIFYAAMHEAIGQRPSLRPVNLFSSGHSSVERAQTPVSEVEVEANCPTSSSTDTATVDLQAENSTDPQSDQPGTSTDVRPGKRKRKSESVDHLKEFCERLEKTQKEENERDNAWLQKSQQQMDRMLDLFGKLVDHMTEK